MKFRGSEAFFKLNKYIKRLVYSRAYALCPFGVKDTSYYFDSNSLLESGVLRGLRPIFIGGEGFCDTSGYEGGQVTPEVRLIELSDVCVVGRTEFILKNGKAFYPEALDPAIYAFMLELEGRGRVDLERRRVRFLPKVRTLQVERAISLLGQCNGNYAHWITEVLARFTLIDEMPHLRDWPILVDFPVHTKLMESIDILSGGQRKIIPVRAYERVCVGSLAYVTLPCLTPPETRIFFEKGILAPPQMEQFKFSDTALKKLRHKAVEASSDYAFVGAAKEKCGPNFIQRDGGLDGVSGARRIYLRRSYGATGNGRDRPPLSGPC